MNKTVATATPFEAFSDINIFSLNSRSSFLKTKKFTLALLQGWREALKPVNTKEALKAIQAVDADTPYSILEVQLDITRSLIQPSSDTPIGAIDVSAWKQTEAIMLEQGQIPGPIDVTNDLFQQF